MDGGAGEAQSLSGDYLFGRFAHPRQLDPQAAVSTGQADGVTVDGEAASAGSGILGAITRKTTRAAPATVTQMPQRTFNEVQPMIGADLIDAEGGKVGKIEDIYLDNESQEPEWALVHAGLLGRKLNYVPPRDASVADNSIQGCLPRVPDQGCAEHRSRRGADPRRGS
ncbi:hypothetical protein BH20ACT1_BH20ACT1_02630 [soil metagenome]